MPSSSPAHARDGVFWFDGIADPAGAPLQGVVTTEVVVVGGGMMGLMCARSLVRRGISVCLVESATCGRGASGRSSGFITPDSELEFADLVHQFGGEQAKRLWLFAWSGIDALRRAISDERIECDLQEQDAMFVAAKPAATKVLAAEQAARAAGGFSSQLYSQSELSGVLGSAEYAGGLAFTGTFSIDGHRCCLGLRKGLLEAGVRIFEHSPVTQILRDGITTAAGSIRAEAVLVCADRFLPSLGLAPFEVYHAQTFLAISEPLRDSVRAIVFPDRPMMVWDTDLVYHYFRLTGDQRLLVGGGTLMSTYSRQEEHQPQKVTRRLSRYLTRHFPALPIRFAACWPGLIGISKDFGPVIGRHLDFPMVHFAGAGAGLPWAAALGGYLADRLIDKRCDLDEMLSDRRRFPVGRRVQRCLGKPATFALAHGMKKFAR